MSTPTESPPAPPVKQQPAEHLRPTPAIRSMANFVAEKTVAVPAAEAPPEVLGVPDAPKPQPKPVETQPKSAEPVAKPPETKSPEPEKKGMLDALPDEPPKPEIKHNREHFKRLEEAKNAAEKRAREAEERLKAAESATPEKITAAEKRAAELEKQLELAAVERSPGFRAKYVEGREAIVAQARALAGELSEDKTVLDRALLLHGKERRDFIDSSFDSPSAVAEFMGMIHNIEAIDAERTAVLEDNAARAALVALEQQQKPVEQVVKKFDALLPVIRTKLGAPFQERDGDDEHNRLVADNLSIARSLVDGTADEQDIAAAPYLAVAARAYMNENIRLRAENEKLRVRVKEYSGSDAGINGGAEDVGDRKGTGKPKGMTTISKERFGGY